MKQATAQRPSTQRRPEKAARLRIGATGLSLARNRHVTADLLRLVAERDLPARALARSLLDHVHATCPKCRAVLEDFARSAAPRPLLEHLLGTEPAPPESGEGIFASLSAYLELAERNPREQGQPAAHEAVEALLAEPEPRRRRRARTARALHRFGTWLRLLGRAERFAAGQPAEAEEAARLALIVAERLDPSRYGEYLVNTCVAGAAAVLARMRVRAGRPGAAKALLSRAAACVAAGPADPSALAEVLMAEADVAQAEGRLRDSVAQLGRAARLYGHMDFPHWEGVARVREGLLWHELGDTTAAAQALAHGLAFLDWRLAPELVEAADKAVRAMVRSVEQAEAGGDGGSKSRATRRNREEPRKSSTSSPHAV